MINPKIVIELDDVSTGALHVDGPCINDKILCYGLLDAAKDIIKEHCDKNNQKLVSAQAMPKLIQKA